MKAAQQLQTQIVEQVSASWQRVSNTFRTQHAVGQGTTLLGEANRNIPPRGRQRSLAEPHVVASPWIGCQRANFGERCETVRQRLQSRSYQEPELQIGRHCGKVTRERASAKLPEALEHSCCGYRAGPQGRTIQTSKGRDRRAARRGESGGADGLVLGARLAGFDDVRRMLERSLGANVRFVQSVGLACVCL